MTHLRLTPEAPPLEDDRIIPIDDPDEPMTEAVLRELELGRATDDGMIEPPGPEMEVPGTEVPGPEDEPRGPGVEVPGTEVPGPEDEPREPGDEVPGPEDEPHEPEADVPAVPDP